MKKKSLSQQLAVIVVLALVLMAAMPAGVAYADSGLRVVSIAGTGDGVYALRSDGTLWAWGCCNVFSSQQLQRVNGLSGVSGVAAGGSSGYALESDGSVWAWGDNSYGELGNGRLGNGSDNSQWSVPERVYGLGDVTAIAGGRLNGYALTSDGTVWAWGDNSCGELGDNSTAAQSTVPERVYGLNQVAAIASGLGSMSAYAVKSDGTVWAWGCNGMGGLGTGNYTTYKNSVPAQVYGLSGVTAIAAGDNSTYALTRNGSVWAWGSDDHGQLGSGQSPTIGESAIPVKIPSLSDVKAIAAGGDSAYALKADGTVWAWGDNGFGQLGNNTTVDSDVPVQVSVLNGVTAIAAGYHSAYALKPDGTVWAWGDNGGDQLGNLSTDEATVPLQLSGGSLISDLAFKDQGTILAAVYGQPYSYTLTAAGGSGQGYTFTPVPGAQLPTWLTLSPDGTVSGTPGAYAAATPVSVMVSDSAGNTVPGQFLVCVNPQNPAPLTLISHPPAATVGVPYFQPLSKGGRGPVNISGTWGGGSGIGIDMFGNLYGTPRQAGTYEYDVAATDNSDPAQTVAGTVYLTVNQGTSGPVTIGSVSAANGKLTVTMSGVDPKWGTTGPNASMFDVKASVNGAPLTPVAVSGIGGNQATVDLYVPSIPPAPSPQSVVYYVSYMGQPAVSSNTLTLPAGTSGSVPLGTINSAVPDNTVLVGLDLFQITDSNGLTQSNLLAAMKTAPGQDIFFKSFNGLWYDLSNSSVSNAGDLTDKNKAVDETSVIDELPVQKWFQAGDQVTDYQVQDSKPSP